MIVLSAHLDDAVWSAHGLLEGATVVSICAGVPAGHVPPTEFDIRAGFESSTEAMKARRLEDVAAAELCGFKPVHMDCMDSGYGQQDVAAVVEYVLGDVGAEMVVGPLGLRHPDHEAVAQAFIDIARARELNAWVYEDLPYAYVWPETLTPAFERAGCGETITRPSQGKEQAVCCYGSQVNESTHLSAILAPERYHRLGGWGRP